MAKTEVFRGLRGHVQLKDGSVATIRRGEKLPSDAAAGEKKKLKDADLLGEPWEYQEPDDVTPEELLAAEPSQEAPSTVEDVERLSGMVSETTSNEELDAFVADHTAKEVVKAADSPETAQALLDAELAVRGKDARSSAISGLVDKGATEPGEEPGDESPGEEATEPAADEAAEGDSASD